MVVENGFLQGRMEEARALFRNEKTTEFLIVTIPTVMAAAESSRLAKALRAESVPVHDIVINQALTRFSHCHTCFRGLRGMSHLSPDP
jgi:anion-transporting  ArsA/GET3 family ATPase